MPQIPSTIEILNWIVDAINSLPVVVIQFYGQIIGGLVSVILLACIIIVSRKVERIVSFKKEELGESTAVQTEAAIAAEKRHQEESQKAWKDVLAKIY